MAETGDAPVPVNKNKRHRKEKRKSLADICDIVSYFVCEAWDTDDIDQ